MKKFIVFIITAIILAVVTVSCESKYDRGRNFMKERVDFLSSINYDSLYRNTPINDWVSADAYLREAESYRTSSYTDDLKFSGVIDSLILSIGTIRYYVEDDIRKAEVARQREEISSKYGKNIVSSIESAFTKVGCKYTSKTLDEYCSYAKDYSLNFILNEISYEGVSNSGYPSLIERIYNLQKKYGWDKVKRSATLCYSTTLHDTDWNKAEAILNGRVAIGFTKDMCRFAWGSPYDINKTTTIYGTHEQWCYHGYNYLYFEDGILTSIQN